MKKFAKMLAVTIGVLMMAGTALAVPISGTINFKGELSVLPVGSTVNTATGIDFLNAEVGGGSTGDFALIPVGTAVTFSDFTFNPSSPVAPLWSLLAGTYSFDLASVAITFQGSNVLALTGSGTIHATGFDDTAGVWSLTTQGASKVLTFSSTAETPEPGTMMLLGAGVIGLGIYGRRRNKK